jgi:hypothetical protein
MKSFNDMLQFKKSIVLFISLFMLGACSSGTTDVINPVPVSTRPKGLEITAYNDKNPTNITYEWKEDLLSSFVIKTINTTTNKDFVRTHDIARNSKKLVQSIKYSYGSDMWDYTYNTDGTQVSFAGKMWTYNSFGNLTSLTYGSGINSGTVNLEYNSANLLTKFRWKEGSFLNNTNTLSSFTTVENPLHIIAKSTQFLNITFNDTDLTLACVAVLPSFYNNGAIDNIVTYQVDENKRITSITVTNNGIVLRKYSFLY